MKKYFYTLLCSLSGLFITSCDKESFRHEINIVYPQAVPIIYADQTLDSICFTTFDSYEAQSAGTPWLKVSSMNGVKPSSTIYNSYYNGYAVTLAIETEANTTGECRVGTVSVRSYGIDWDQTAYASYYQVTWHNITMPKPTYELNDSGYPKSAEFVATVDADTKEYDLAFKSYANYTMEVKSGDFASFGTDLEMGTKGWHQLTVFLKENTTKEKREAELVLKSAGIETPIKIVQAGKKE